MGTQSSKIAGTFAVGVAVGVAVGSLVSGKFRTAKGQAEVPQEAPTHAAVVTTPTLIVRVELLKQFTRAVFEHCGVEPEAAAEAAEVLLLADMRGIYSHGIARLHAYFEMLCAGVINARPDVRIVHETSSTATVDGDNGLGLVVGPAANRIAMAKAEQCGSGWVTVRNTHHVRPSPPCPSPSRTADRPTPAPSSYRSMALLATIACVPWSSRTQ